MLGILSAVAPPINVWAMLMAAGANMPYVGSTWCCWAPVLTITVVVARLGAVPVEGGHPRRPASDLAEDDVVAGGRPAAVLPRWRSGKTPSRCHDRVSLMFVISPPRRSPSTRPTAVSALARVVNQTVEQVPCRHHGTSGCW
jgi:hypothetical protein